MSLWAILQVLKPPPDRELTMMLTIGTQTPGPRNQKVNDVDPLWFLTTSQSEGGPRWATLHNSFPLRQSLKNFPLRSPWGIWLFEHQVPGLLAWCLQETLDFPSLQLVWGEWLYCVGWDSPECDSATRLASRYNYRAISKWSLFVAKIRYKIEWPTDILCLI